MAVIAFITLLLLALLVLLGLYVAARAINEAVWADEAEKETRRAADRPDGEQKKKRRKKDK